MSKSGLTWLLAGGTSAEREISLASGNNVAKALSELGIDYLLIDPAQRVDWHKQEVDRVIIMLHGGEGEDGTLQQLLSDRDIAYSGSRAVGCANAMNKHLSKQIWQKLGLPTAPYHVCTDPAEAELAFADLAREQYGVFVKPVNGGSSIFTLPVKNIKQLREQVEQIVASGDSAIVEPCLVGDELTVAVVEDQVMPVIKIIADAQCEFYDYEAKYKSDNTKMLCPSQLPQAVEEQVLALAQSAFGALGCSNWGRVDLILDKKFGMQLLEVNTVPGMTSHSLVPCAAAERGISFTQLVQKIWEGCA